MANSPTSPKALSRKPDASRVAVALDYRWPQTGAPTVVATGRGEIADRIVDVARSSGVPLHNNPALAQALSGIEPGECIPFEAFAAVAEILSFLYRLDRSQQVAARMSQEDPR